MNEQTTGVIDPVCGMTVYPAATSHSAGHNGKNYYFCSNGCVQKFKTQPEQYLNKSAKPTSGFVRLGMPTTVSGISAKVKDPVCGMDVDPATAKHKLEHD